MRNQARDLLLDNGIDIDVDQDLASYSTAIQQMVAITRAISQNAKLLIMDEPTSSLADDEVQVMFEKMRELVKKGMSIIFISHKPDEVFTICDRVTILKDGNLVGSFDMDKITRLDQLICNLSGGNQQKVLLGRWLSMGPKLIILDEPTRGIDVGAKAEIEALIKQFSENGISVLYISSEPEELIRNCYRVVVIRDGKNSAQLCGEEITEENIMKYIAKNMKETEVAHG